MRKLLLLALLFLVSPTFTFAHLCNDVFVQAKDNLVVKVDIRDGQLRIGKEASFKVYLLNTMDREIVNITLQVITDKFNSTVTPSSDWRDYPLLKTTLRGGKKEFFEVTLERKKGVADGKYTIELKLVNGQRTSMEFKTIDLDASADLFELEKAKDIKIDGKPSATEWKKTHLATDFYSYVKKGRYYENVRVDDQPRFRIGIDDKYIYGLLTFTGYKNAEEDVAKLYIAKSIDDTPKEVAFSRITGKMLGEKVEGADFDFDNSKENCEFRIPREYFGIDSKETKLFCANFTRAVTTVIKVRDKEEQVTETHFWRGNTYSDKNPLVYAKFTIPQ